MNLYSTDLHLKKRKSPVFKRIPDFNMAEKEGFEPSIPFWGIHDFQSCALGQLRDFSIRTAHAASPVIIQQVSGFVKNFLPNFKNIFPSAGFCRRREKVSMGELAHIQLGVESALLEQFLVLSLLHNVAVPHYQDQVRSLNGRQPMGHNEGGPALHHGIEGLLNPDFRPGVDGGRGLVQEQHGRQTQHHPGNAQQLLLALGQIAPGLGDHRVVALG